MGSASIYHSRFTVVLQRPDCVSTVNHCELPWLSLYVDSGPAAEFIVYVYVEVYVYVNTYMATIKHKQYTSYILESVSRVNPHTGDQGRIGYVYASGFLASYLANILAEDPIAMREFERHIEHRRNHK